MIYLISEENKDLPEDCEEVDEELQAVEDVVGVAASPLLDDELGVVHDEPAHHRQADVEVGLGEHQCHNKMSKKKKKKKKKKTLETDVFFFFKITLNLTPNLSLLIIAVMFIYIFIRCPLTWDR